MPGFIGHFHLDQHITREELALGNGATTVLDVDHFFNRHQHLAKQILQTGALDALTQRLLHTLLETGVRVHDIPTLCHD
ncbi:hypothetical protein D3C71_1965180 [compost metagenome]